MISINRKKKREEIRIFERANREREGRKKKKRKEGKIREKGKRIGGNKFKGKIMYKCVFFKP